MLEQVTGIGFPFRIDRGIRRSRGLEKIEEDLRHLLSTRIRERTMLRDYGGGIHNRRQEPNSSTLRALVKHEIEKALRAYMPGVRLTQPISVTVRESTLVITLEYTPSAEGISRQLEIELA